VVFCTVAVENWVVISRIWNRVRVPGSDYRSVIFTLFDYSVDIFIDVLLLLNILTAEICVVCNKNFVMSSLQPEAFDVEKGLQVQLIPNYNVWVSKSKLQFIMKEALSQKEGAPLFVLRRLIPLVFTWEELAASRGQGLNCKSTEDVMNKDPLDPTKVLVCKGQILHKVVYVILEVVSIIANTVQYSAYTLKPR